MAIPGRLELPTCGSADACGNEFVASWNHHPGGSFLLYFIGTDFRSQELKMIQRVMAEVLVGLAVLVGLLVAGPAAAQTTTPSSEKQETGCNTSAAATSGSAGQTTSNSMAMEKSAILPSAGGHANSAAPTVQSGGKPMEVRPDCPPDSKPK
jgi:hypothetical protein